jgi:2-amino-4-hydroxy-6-hydroxymethyldihydropteridine diphosphokinase
MTETALLDIYISAGSNIEPEKNLHLAYREIEHMFGPLSRSSTYRTKAIGFDGGDFLNLVMCFSTRESLDKIVAEMQRVEALSGRPPIETELMSRTLDLDLLLYGPQILKTDKMTLPRPDITQYAFVLGPMAELAPDLLLPGSVKTMRELWQEFDGSEQPIERLPDFSPD